MLRAKSMKTTFLLAAAFLGSTALAVPVFAQDASAPNFQLTGSGGVLGINIPSYTNAIAGQTASGNLIGGMIGGSLSTGKIGDANGWGVILGINAFGAFGMGQSASTTQRLTGHQTIVGLDDAGTTSVSLGVNNTATATGAGGSDTTSTTSGANVAGIVPDGTGFEYSAVTTNGAYAGIGSSSGGRFEFDGPVDATTVISRSVLYGGADLTIGMDGSFDSATNVQVFGGPSVRALAQNNRTSETFDVPEASGGTPITIPTYTLALNDDLMSTYLGGVIGSNVSFAGGNGIIFTLGAQGGIYTVHSTYNGHDTYSTCCGVTGSPQNIASPSISVDGPSHTSDLGNTVAFAAQGSGSATIALDATKSFTFGGDVGYLSYVPTVNRTGPGVGGVSFGSGSMITYGVKGSLTGHF